MTCTRIATIGSRSAIVFLLFVLLPLAAAAQSPAKSGGATAKVDLNTASLTDLEALPGVGPATAKKIVGGRPYASVNDLAKAGVPARTIQSIAGFVVVSGARASAPAPTVPPAPPPAASAHASTPASASSNSATTPTGGNAVQPAGPPPVKGMVWVNTDTKVYHFEGDRYYGKTKDGKYMTEADAIKAGYRAAKSGGTEKK